MKVIYRLEGEALVRLVGDIDVEDAWTREYLGHKLLNSSKEITVPFKDIIVVNEGTDEAHLRITVDIPVRIEKNEVCRSCI